MVGTRTITLLHPAAEDLAERHYLAPRLAGLQGMTIGMIDNRKRNANVYLEELGRLFKEQYGVAQVISYRKASQSMPTPPEVLDDLSARCDALVHAVADWGSCTTWGLHDGVESEKRGRPAVTVITQAFVHAAQIRARTLGMTDHPVVVIEHPIASKNQAQIQETARQSVKEVIEGLLRA